MTTMKPNWSASGINPHVDKIEVGQKLGLAWTANNEKYRAVVEIVRVNAKSVVIKLVDKTPKAYDVGQTWNVNIFKPTKDNHLFKLDGVSANTTPELIESFNNNEHEMNELVRGKINEYWKKKINQMETERKEQGVFVESEVYKIDQNGLTKSHNSYGVSA